MTLVIIVFYIFGISWKVKNDLVQNLTITKCECTYELLQVIKIYKGEYEPQEPVYLKYK